MIGLIRKLYSYKCSEDLWCGRTANEKKKGIFIEASACVKADSELSDSFTIGVGVRHVQYHNV